MISRPLKEGFRGVARHWGMSISASIAVTITLVMISLFMIFSFNLENFTKDIESSLEISVLVDYDYESKEQIDRIDSELNAITGVAEVTFSSKEQEFEYYLNSFEDTSTRSAFEPFRDDNPMHNAFYLEAK